MSRTLFILYLLIIYSNSSSAISVKTELDTSIYEHQSCEEMYYQVSELEIHTLNFESPIYNSRNNTIASVTSTVFTPAVFFVGFSHAMTFKSEIDASKISQELNYLRRRMGEMRCFTK